MRSSAIALAIALPICISLAGCAPAGGSQIRSSSPLSSLPPSPKMDPTAISAEVNRIDSSLEELEKTETDIEGQSAEGGKLTGFAQRDTLSFRKIEAVFYGETGQAKTSFYFTSDGRLIYARKQTLRYASPISPSSPPLIDKVTEGRYAFQGDDAFVMSIDGSVGALNTDDGQQVRKLGYQWLSQMKSHAMAENSVMRLTRPDGQTVPASTTAK